MTVAPNKRNNFKAVVLKGAYLLIVLVAVYFIDKNPIRFWDMLPYMGSVASIDKNDSTYIHKMTYTEFNKYATPKMKASMLRSDSFCINMSENAENFYQQLPFFKIKFLYIYTSWAFANLGLSLFNAVLLPSLLSFIFISLFIYFWLGKYYKPWVTFLLSVFFIFLNLQFDAFRIALPDAMAGCFLLPAAYFFINKRHIQSCVFLLLSLLTRPDNVFFIVLLCVFFSIFYYRENKRSAYTYLSFILLSFFAVFFIQAQSGEYDAYRMFYRSFVHLTETPYSSDIRFNMQDYLSGIGSGLKTSLHKSGLYLLFGLLVFYRFIKKTSFRSQEGMWITAMLSSFVLRIFTHPLFETRYIFIFLIVLTLLILIEMKKNVVKWST